MVAMYALGLLLALTYVSGEEYVCQVGKYGKLSMFSGETGNVELPCKYIMTEMTCGEYQVKVTGGSASDGMKDNRYSPRTAWVKVEQGSNAFFARIDIENFDIEDENVWTIKDDLTNFTPDTVGYDPARKAAIIGVPGVFEVSFSQDSTLRISCKGSPYASTAYPVSICGAMNEQNTNLQSKDKRALFKGISVKTEKSYSLSFHILNNTRVTQSSQCEAVADKFQRCYIRGGHQRQAEAIARCVRVFADRSLSNCVNMRPNDVNAFRLCIRNVGCNNVDSLEGGAMETCNFLRTLLERRQCMDEWEEIEREFGDCPAPAPAMMDG